MGLVQLPTRARFPSRALSWAVGVLAWTVANGVRAEDSSPNEPRPVQAFPEADAETTRPADSATAPSVQPSTEVATSPSSPRKTTDQCLLAHERSQVARKQGDLLAAREALLHCSRAACSTPVRGDCVRWFEQLKTSLPSLVFAASLRGNDVTDVKVELNGVQIATRLDGRAIDVNPGEHRLRFIHSSGRTIERRLLIREGEQNRVIVAEFLPPPRIQPQEPQPPGGLRRPAPASTVSDGFRLPPAYYITGAVALVSAGLATYSGLSALSDANAARDTGCDPFCEEDRVRAIRRKTVVADLSALVALLAAADTLYLYLSREADAEQQTHGKSGATGSRGPNVAVTVRAVF